MKRFLLTAVTLLAFTALRAQVVVLNDNMWVSRLSEIHATVVDSLSNEPVPYASFYVIPEKDTTITNFTLTDPEGKAKLEEVPYGRYTLHVEMMGYLPVIKTRYFRDSRVDIGTIRLVVDEHYLDAAVVTDKGNPVTIKEDTLEYNASSFHVGSNAMLKDLLKKMPGIEVSDDGTVKVNGEPVDKITVGGKTFFFNDKSAALNNLPAAIVDKIRVTDRTSESTRATGIEDGSKEKVMDVVLKKEYEKGWFGNIAGKGGTTLVPKQEGELRDDRGFLYSGNLLVSGYTEKDQVTGIVNLQNVDDGGVVFRISEDGETTQLGGNGLSDFAQAGVNATTDRIKDVETAVMANYKYNDTRGANRSSRTTWQTEGDILSETDNTSRGFGNSFNSKVELKKEKGKVWFHFRPNFTYSKTDSWSSGTSATSREGILMNRSEQSTYDGSISRSGNLTGDVSFRDLGGKEGRIIQASYGLNLNASDGGSDESSLTQRKGAEDFLRQLHYDSQSASHGGGGSLRYTEPLGKKWTLSMQGSFNATLRNSVRDASDAMGYNDYYSSEVHGRQLQNNYDATIQYKWGKNNWVTVGALLSGLLDENRTRSFGIDTETGVGDWSWYVTPTLRLRSRKGNSNFNVHVSGATRSPSRGQMLPVLNVGNPTRLSAGNIYLKPYGYTTGTVSWYRNDPKDFSMVMMSLSATMRRNSVSSAQWYDASSILYSVPVNVRKPALSTTMYLSYAKPFGKEKHWTMDTGFNLNYSKGTSYQAKGTLPGVDTETFDYASFMEGFWGTDASGSNFYSGKSGFSESVTRSSNLGVFGTINYNKDPFSMYAGVSAAAGIARYSLDSSVNRQTFNEYVSLGIDYKTPHAFEIDSNLGYTLYQGYAAGFNEPELRWNASVTKNIGAFSLSITAHDILNQTRGRSHSITANYEEDSYRLILGRYILFGVKWNFGKMNAAHSQRANSAAMDMAF